MARVTYEVVEHDGGWAYRVGATFSETFATHGAAHKAAERAAAEQTLTGETTDIAYQDARGEEHVELARDNDRPQTEVKDEGRS